MKKLTYKQAYDKIIEAYFKDEIKPMNFNFCFCGTLASGVDKWYDEKDENLKLYTISQYFGMEHALLRHISLVDKNRMPNSFHKNEDWVPSKEYEENLFTGMCEALEVLKKIHIERGEVIEEDLPFTKRQLQSV